MDSAHTSMPGAFAAFHHTQWLELAIFLLLVVLTASVLVFVPVSRRRKPAPRFSAPRETGLPHGLAPELRLVCLALPMELLWEIAQFPLYTVWHQNDWGYILYGLAHCTLGDIMILLVLYWLIALVRRDRHWIDYRSLGAGAVFTLGGLAYTVYSETVNVRLQATWGYTELMPIVPGIGIGGMPFLQWLLIPPILLLAMRHVRFLPGRS